MTEKPRKVIDANTSFSTHQHVNTTSYPCLPTGNNRPCTHSQLPTMVHRLVPLLLLLLFSSSTHAFPSGAGDCPEGQAAVGGSHLGGRNVISGPLEDNDLRFNINGTDAEVDTPIVLEVGVEYEFTLSTSVGEAFRGLLIRLGGGSHQVDTTEALSHPYTDCCVKVSDKCLNDYGVGGLTHADTEMKAGIYGSIVVEEVSEDMPLDITVVINNRRGISTYYYSQFLVTVVDRNDEGTSNPTGYASDAWYSGAPSSQGTHSDTYPPSSVWTWSPTESASIDGTLSPTASPTYDNGGWDDDVWNDDHSNDDDGNDHGDGDDNGHDDDMFNDDYSYDDDGDGNGNDDGDGDGDDNGYDDDIFNDDYNYDDDGNGNDDGNGDDDYGDDNSDGDDGYGDNQLYCGDSWAFGYLVGDCYAVDSSYCVEESYDDEWKVIDADFFYYNAMIDTYDNMVEYGSVSVSLMTGQGGYCSVLVDGVDCTCSSEGTVVTVESCDGLSGGSLMFDGLPQSIRLLEEGGSLEMVSTDGMCAHPSVLAQQSGKSQQRGRSSPRLRKEATKLTVPIILELGFTEEPEELDHNSKTKLLSSTMDFLKDTLKDDPAFGSAILSVKLEQIHITFGDLMSVAFKAKISMDSSLPKPPEPHTLVTLANAKWAQYIHDLKKKSGIPAALRKIERVRFKGIGTGSPTGEDEEKN